jgi:voltage-dependent calcium channel L type alpha-1C/voltage-dependent calcium channel L type alpha-1D
MKRAKKLQMIFDTLVIAAPAMGSLGILLLLLIILFAIIGMQLFAFVKLQSELNARANFQTFTNSFLLLMRCATGEGWNALMFDTARSNSINF